MKVEDLMLLLKTKNYVIVDYNGDEIEPRNIFEQNQIYNSEIRYIDNVPLYQNGYSKILIHTDYKRAEFPKLISVINLFIGQHVKVFTKDDKEVFSLSEQGYINYENKLQSSLAITGLSNEINNELISKAKMYFDLRVNHIESCKDDYTNITYIKIVIENDNNEEEED